MTADTARRLIGVGQRAGPQRELIRDRALAGGLRRVPAAAGVPPGRDHAGAAVAARAMREQKHTMAEIGEELGVSPATLYRHLGISDEQAA